MESSWNDVRTAAQRGSAAIGSAPLAILAPLLCYEVGYRLLLFGLHRAFGRHHVSIELVAMLVVFFPLAQIAEAVIARMLWVLRGGRLPGLAQAREVVQAPGLARTLLRLLGLTTGCMLLAAVMLLLWFGVGVMTKAVFFGLAHPGVKMPRSHRSTFPFVLQFVLIYAILVSRYSFVLPVFAAAGEGGAGLLPRAVSMAKLVFVPLALLSMVEYGLVFSLAHFLRQVAVGGLLRVAAATSLTLAVTAGITTWFEAVKAELAFQRLDAAPPADALHPPGA